MPDMGRSYVFCEHKYKIFFSKFEHILFNSDKSILFDNKQHNLSKK